MEKPVIALVGGETLLGRDLREVLSEQRVAAHVKLIGAGDSEGILSKDEDEPVVISALDADNLSGARVVLLAGSAWASRKTLELVSGRQERPRLVDLSGGLEDDPRARLRAPMVEPEDREFPADSLHVVAHPASIALALLLARLASGHAIRRSVVEVFEPASERGQRGLTELQQQTVNLLSFRKLPQAVFDAQLSFNMLARYGCDAPVKLEEIETRIERNLATLAAALAIVPMLSIRLVQAPVFHGYSISVWVEFEENPGAAALARALACERIEVRGADQEPPTNVGAAGQSGLTVGLIETDRNQPRAAWLWVTADNLRLAAENGVAVARRLL